MKNLKQLLATGTIMAALMVGTTFAGTGLLVSDLADSDPCSEETNATGLLVSDFAGLLVSDFAGLLVSDYTGIIVHGVTDEESTDEEPLCGIIVHG